MTTIETERARLRQLRGYYGHLRRADMRTRTELGEIFLGERKRACLGPLLEETRRDIEEAERTICAMVKNAGTARRDAGGRPELARASDGSGRPAGEAQRRVGGRR